MSSNWRTVGTLLVMTGMTLCVSTALLAAETGVKEGKRVDVDPVDVPEKTYIEPTPAEIHEDFPDRSCSSCHTQGALEGEPKSMNHFLTTKDCAVCHFDKSWVPLRNYMHMTGKYPGMLRSKQPDIDPQDCKACHTSNIEFQAR